MLRVVGTASSVARVSVLLFTVVVRSMTGDCPDTMIDSSSDPIFMPTSTRAEKPSERTKSCLTSVWNPVSENAILKRPGGRFGTR
jgi:hypothetical protein